MIDLPHHDGSARHVDPDVPRLGATVTVRIRVPHDFPVRAVHVRSIRDGEPHWASARVERADAHEQWWQAPLLVANPVTNYRFLLERDDGYVWLNGTGVHQREVSDAHDFLLTTHPRAPEWVDDAVIYQVFPDRFARSRDASDMVPGWAVPAAWDDPVVERGPDTPRQFYGGDLPGIEEHLDHLVELGANVLYLTPFFPAESNHRYNAATFGQVDPLLGGDEALASLVKAAHARGLRVLGDLTTNHTGSTHEWFLRAAADADAPEAGFYVFHDHPDDYEAWLGEPTLPKLDLRDAELRRRLVEGPDSVVGRYLRPPFELDGWRIDVANMTGRCGDVDVNGEVAAAIRRTMEATVDDGYLLAEHFHDAADDLRRDGWHGVMNYLGFLRPLWMWLRAPETHLPFLGMPVEIPSVGGDLAAATMREVAARLPWSAFTASAILLGSHDTPRLRTVVGSPGRQLVAVGILATYPGVPLVFMGDEYGFEGVDGEDARTPMPWGRFDDEALQLATAYRRLFELRRAHEALRRGGLRWVAAEPEHIAYLRETASERLLVVAIREGHASVRLPATILTGAARSLYGELGVTEAADGTLLVSGTGPAFGVVRL